MINEVIICIEDVNVLIYMILFYEVFFCGCNKKTTVVHLKQDIYVCWFTCKIERLCLCKFEWDWIQ